MKILSINICGLTPKKFEKLNVPSYDIVFLQEVRLNATNIDTYKADGYTVIHSLAIYAGVIMFIKNNIVFEDYKELVVGRMQHIKINDIHIFNIYHKRVTKRADLDPRMRYDKQFINIIDEYKTKNMLMLGDFNSVHKFHDSVKNLAIADNGSPGSYERQFMSTFITNNNLIDVGNVDDKKYTFYKFGKPCMRIDFCLVRFITIKNMNIVYDNELSDHVQMIIDY